MPCVRSDPPICTWSFIKGVSGRSKYLILPCIIQKYDISCSLIIQHEDIYLRQCSPSHRKILENNLLKSWQIQRMLAHWGRSTKALPVEKKEFFLHFFLSQIASPTLIKYFLYYIGKGEACAWHQQCSDLCIFSHFQIKITVFISEIYFQM